MSKQYYEQMPDGSMMNAVTGEILDQRSGTFIHVPYKVKFNEEWFMAFQEALEQLAADRDLWGRPRAVLDYLMARLSFENFIAIEQKEICDKLNLNKSNVSAAIKVLVDKEILKKGPKIGRTHSYRLNPFYGWKGKVKNLQEARKSHLKILSNTSKDK